MRVKTDDSKYLDPVFLKYGKRVYTYEYIEKLRKENLQKKRNGKRITSLVPQKGFQENALLVDADIKIEGGKRGLGKAVPLNTKVVTPFGYRSIGELSVGDQVLDPTTGLPQDVVQIFDHTDKDIYNVYFSDGTSCQCCDEHLWQVKEMNTKCDRAHDWKVMTFKQMMTNLDKWKKEGSDVTYALPTNKACRFLYKNRIKKEVDPFVLGISLGYGIIAKDATNQHYDVLVDIPEEREWIVKEVKKTKMKMGGYKRLVGRTTFRIYDDDLKAQLRIDDQSFLPPTERRIPNYIKRADVRKRYYFVQGLMAMGGDYIGDGTYTLSLRNEKMAKDFLDMIRALGAIATMEVKHLDKKDWMKWHTFSKTAYIVTFTIERPEYMTRDPRLKKELRDYFAPQPKLRRHIIGYDYAGKMDARCITVSGTSSLYMLNDYIVTHNTWLALFEALPYIFNPDVNMYGFRKYEGDIARGIWKSSKQVFRHFGTPAEANYEWKFLGGKGATMKMEHLQDPKKVSDRFRGVEMAYIAIEELAEHTRDDMNVLFELLSSNRSTSGVTPKCVCTCNPVGKSNKLRYFLDWYIDPETNTVIKERSGKVRYFYRYGEDVMEIAWGDTPEEVFNNPLAHGKIEELCASTGQQYTDFITSLVFIDGDFKDNEILHVSDAKYMSRISARGGESTTNDIEGVWVDIDTGTGMLTSADMEKMFDNTERTDGVMRASADVALTGDFFVIFAFDGHHVCDMEAWRGNPTVDCVPFIRQFLKRNGVREDCFTYDSNGLGLWLASAFPKAVPFNNKSASSDPRLWGNLKSECAEKFVKAVKNGDFSISEVILRRTFTDSKKHTFTVRERLQEERRVIKRKENDAGRFEIIPKTQMKLEIGHSPDFIEALFMVMHLFERSKAIIRRGFSNW